MKADKRIAFAAAVSLLVAGTGCRTLGPRAVEVSSRDVEAGRVTVTRTLAGQVFDWKNVSRQLLRIQSAPTRPAMAAASVWYRGTWFYIDDSDLNTKSTFALLTQLVALQSGEVSRLTPVLTLPVGK